jgi:uncharacterized protein YndB with AHSA1/START domain
VKSTFPRNGSSASAALVLLCLLAAPLASATESIQTDGIVNAPVADVWNAWATSAGLRSWLAPNADIDLRVGGLMRANYRPGGTLGDPNTIENRILSYEPESMLSIQVTKAPDGFPFKTAVQAMWTVLHFEEAGPGRTRIRIVGLGFTPDAESQRMKAFFNEGNAETLVELQHRFDK